MSPDEVMSFCVVIFFFFYNLYFIPLIITDLLEAMKSFSKIENMHGLKLVN